MVKKCPKCKSDMRYEEVKYNNSPCLPSGSAVITSSSCSANRSDGGCWRCDKCGYVKIDNK